MRNVTMIRQEPGLVSIPVVQAVYCENCQNVSTSSNRRCGLCASENITDLIALIVGTPWEPGAAPALAMTA